MEFSLTGIISFLSPIASAAASALIIFFVEHHRQETDKKRDEREEAKSKETTQAVKARADETLLTIKMLTAIGKLTFANSVAIKDGKVNGVMGEAMECYQIASGEMECFLQRQGVAHITER